MYLDLLIKIESKVVNKIVFFKFVLLVFKGMYILLLFCIDLVCLRFCKYFFFKCFGFFSFFEMIKIYCNDFFCMCIRIYIEEK